ncbi:MAG: bacillithiol biosynthesis cysteine-adding enzyme BshC [Bacteroidetes bacterium]|nr:MAG: bacillithiol biosynthesis cysteine-adding enzyme BshC [Bacteroidota bacterium]
MQYSCLPFEATHAFSNIFLDYVAEKPALRDFYAFAPRIGHFAQMIANKKFEPSQRQTLVEALKQQYATVPNAPTAQIEALLQPNTFTVTTGHQLCLYTGPMYFVYKILTTIRLAEELKKNYPDYHFVPIFWLASEDHDFEEVNHFHLFGQKITWESTQKGAVGKFATAELANVFAQMQERLPNWEAIYLESNNLAEATIRLVHTLFGQYGIVSLDADSPALKQALRPVMERDIFEQASYLPVQQTNERLAQAGYKAQVNPREINFFYLREGFRERIVQTEKGFQTVQGEYAFTANALKQEIAEHPERFSPNVMLRPLYQEMILPNLAYIGGPGELAYWLQFKQLFETYNVAMPVLFPRNFGLIIQKTVGKKIAKLNFSMQDLFLPEAEQKAKITAQTTGEPVSLEAQRHAIETTFQAIAQAGEVWDKTLIGSIDAEKHKTLKGIEQLEKRLRKAQEAKAETELKQLASIREKIFPQGNLQERHDNYLNFSLNNSSVLHTIYQTLEPFNNQLFVWQEEI